MSALRSDARQLQGRQQRRNRLCAPHRELPVEKEKWNAALEYVNRLDGTSGLRFNRLAFIINYQLIPKPHSNQLSQGFQYIFWTKTDFLLKKYQ